VPGGRFGGKSCPGKANGGNSHEVSSAWEKKRKAPSSETSGGGEKKRGGGSSSSAPGRERGSPRKKSSGSFVARRICRYSWGKGARGDLRKGGSAKAHHFPGAKERTRAKGGYIFGPRGRSERKGGPFS